MVKPRCLIVNQPVKICTYVDPVNIIGSLTTVSRGACVGHYYNTHYERVLRLFDTHVFLNKKKPNSMFSFLNDLQKVGPMQPFDLGFTVY